MDHASIGFFDVDTRCVDPSGTCRIFRERIRPIQAQIDTLLTFAAEHSIPIVSTGCVNAGPIPSVLPPDVLTIRMDEEDERWERNIAGRREIYLEKRSAGSPEINRKLRAYDIFHVNPCASRLIRLLGIRQWVVFGDSGPACFRTAVEGILTAGCEVLMVTDAVGHGAGTSEEVPLVFAALQEMGATTITSSELLASFG